MTNRICRNCDFENTNEAMYCESCGEQLGDTCKNCGSLNFSSSICNSCGRVISSAFKTDEFEWTSPSVATDEQKLTAESSETEEEISSLPRPGEIGKLISASVNAYKSNFIPFITLALISSIPTTILLYFADGLVSDLTNFFPNESINSSDLNESEININWGLILPLLIFTIIGEIISTASIIFGSAQHINSEKVKVSTCLSYSFSSFIRLIGVVFAFLIILIVPGILSFFFIGIPILIFLIVKLWFSTCFVMIENAGILDSIRRSWSLVQSKWWITFGTGAVIIIISGLASLALSFIAIELGSLFDNRILSQALTGLSATLIAPFQAIATGIYFLGLRKSKRFDP